jgi:hypothetical protein
MAPVFSITSFRCKISLLEIEPMALTALTIPEFPDFLHHVFLLVLCELRINRYGKRMVRSILGRREITMPVP